MGAFIGNSIGSYFESKDQIPDDEVLEKCMEMNGGGPFGVGPGQVTEGSELAMCLMHGLIDSNVQSKEDNRVMDCDIIAT